MDTVLSKYDEVFGAFSEEFPEVIYELPSIPPFEQLYLVTTTVPPEVRLVFRRQPVDIQLR
jgi:hypothetical protein